MSFVASTDVGDVTVLGAGQYAMRIWLNPDLLQARGSDAAGRDQRHPAAEPGSHRRPGRRASRAERPGFSVYAKSQRPPRRSRRVREHHRQGRFRRTADSITRIRDIGHVELGAQTYSTVVQSRRPTGRRDRHLSLAGRQRHRGLQRGESENGRARQELPGGPRLRHRPTTRRNL